MNCIPEHFPSIDNSSEDARTQITAGIDGVAAVHSEAHSNHGDHESCHQRVQEAGDVAIASVADRRHAQSQNTRSHDLRIGKTLSHK